MYNTNLSADSNGGQYIQFPNKTNMSINKNHYNNLISIDKSSYHLQNNIKLAKSNIPTPTPIIQQLIPSTSRSYNTISAPLLTNLNKHISSISSTIINSSAITKPKQQFITKINKNAEKLKNKILTPSRPHVTSCTYRTREEPNSKHSVSTTYSSQERHIPDLSSPTSFTYCRYPRSTKRSPYQAYKN